MELGSNLLASQFYHRIIIKFDPVIKLVHCCNSAQCYKYVSLDVDLIGICTHFLRKLVLYNWTYLNSELLSLSQSSKVRVFSHGYTRM